MKRVGLMMLGWILMGTALWAQDDSRSSLERRDLALVNPLGLTPEMREWTRRIAPTSVPEELRLRLLLRALLSESQEGLQEISDQTATAIEAFEKRKADCVAFALLFVALSREVEIPTYFVMTTEPEQIENRGDLHLAVRHLAVGYGPRVRPHVLDFGGKSRPSPEQIEVLHDDAAIAIYFSNQGIQQLLRGDAATALLWLEYAVELAPELAAVRANLEVAHRRLARSQPLQQLAEAPPASLASDP